MKMTMIDISRSEGRTTSPPTRSAVVWASVGFASWAGALVLTWQASFSDLRSAFLTLLPFLLLVAMMSSFAKHPDLSTPFAVAAMAITLLAWTVLILHDDRWSVLTYGLYALCFPKGRIAGVVLSAFVSVVWLIAWIDDDAPTWRLLIPLAAFAAGAILSATIRRAEDENAAQAELIAELRATRQDLAVSERERGTLQERARFAGEIHDTLAQGFTSIVLLSRVTRRTEDWDAGLESIEATAAENLQAARRLVAAMKPAELDAASLPDAIERQLRRTYEAQIAGHFLVSGSPSPLPAQVEVALLRTAQEALLNVRTHAQASEVHVTLTYFESEVALDVQDDGVGFVAGPAANRGSLTGGQGLDALRHRTETLGGNFTMEARQGGGTILSVRLPAGAPS